MKQSTIDLLVDQILISQSEEAKGQPHPIPIKIHLNQLDPESNLAKFLDALAGGDKRECLRFLIQEYLSLPKRHQRCHVLSRRGARAIAGFTRK